MMLYPMPCKIGFFIIVALAGYGTSPQTFKSRKAPTPESHNLTYNQLATAARMYLRDSAEFPLEMQIRMEAIDASGHTVKRDEAAGTYDFRGYNPSSGRSKGHASLNRSLFHLHRFLMLAFRNSILAPALPSFFLMNLKDAPKAYFLEMSDSSTNSQLVTARMSPRPGACSEFKWSTRYEAPEKLCGAGQFELQKKDLSLQHFSFDAGGLPVSASLKAFGKCQLHKYHAEIEFQEINLPGDPEPFVLPKRVEVIVQTDKGKLVMTTEYALSK